LASTPDALGNLARCRAALEGLGRDLGFDLRAGERMIADRDDAAAVARELADWGADLVLLLCNSFTPEAGVVLPFAALPARLGLWALPEPARAGPLQLTALVDLNLFASMLAHETPEAKPRCKWFLGEPEDPAFRRRLAVTVGALRVLKGLAGATIAQVGGHAPGFDNLAFDARRLGRTLGLRVEALPLEDVFTAARACPDAEAHAGAERIERRAAAVDCPRADLVQTGRIVWALRHVATQGGFDALAVSCWPGFYETLGLFPCVAYGTLNDEGLVVACEGDVLGAVTLLALRLAGGGQPLLMDLVAALPKEDAVCFWHCGLATWEWADRAGVRLIARPVPQSDGSELRLGGFAHVIFAPGPATVARLSRDGAQWLVASATATDRLGPSYEGSGGWFDGVRIAGQRASPSEFLDAIVRAGVEHHYGVALGDASDALLEAARWTGARLVEARPVHDHI
jgi:L-fucose isomerase-like protein